MLEITLQKGWTATGEGKNKKACRTGRCTKIVADYYKSKSIVNLKETILINFAKLDNFS